MGDPSDFTVKEIVIDIKDTLSKHIEKTDERLDDLEGDSKTIYGVFKFAGWILGSSGLVFGLMYIVKMIAKQ